MAEAGRRVLLENTTPGERFDLGLELSDAMMTAVASRAPVPAEATEEERARLRFWALRKAEA